jgi:hypothetical protein
MSLHPLDLLREGLFEKVHAPHALSPAMVFRGEDATR